MIIHTNTLRFRSHSIILLIVGSFILLTSCRQDKVQAIPEEVFGVMPKGDTVKAYTLSNTKGMEVKILNYGGIIQSLKVPDKNGKNADVVLGFDGLDRYIEDSPYFGALVGRYGNRIADGKFTLNDSTYTLAKNDGPNSLHGGREGFDKKIWEVSPFETDTTMGLNLRYSSPDGEEGYPGRLDVRVSYTLTENNALHIEYRARTNKPTVVNLTNHAYFNLSGADKSIKDHELMINATRFLPVDSTLIPTGELRLVESTPMDFRKLTTVGKRINEDDKQLNLGSNGYDHCWVLNTNGNLEQLAVELYEPDSGRKMEVYTTEPGIQFYSGNQLDGSITGKYGYSYQKYAALALETEHFPDSPNQSDFPSTLLDPSQEYYTETVYKFSVE